MRYNIEHLAPAVALRSPAMFAGYAQWLGDLLRSRGIPTDETVLSPIRPCLEAGVSALDGGRHR
jgi:hypothetical protein